MMKTLAGKDTCSTDTELLIRNTNAYPKFVDATRRVLALMLEKVWGFCLLNYFEVL